MKGNFKRYYNGQWIGDFSKSWWNAPNKKSNEWGISELTALKTIKELNITIKRRYYVKHILTILFLIYCAIGGCTIELHGITLSLDAFKDKPVVRNNINKLKEIF